VSFGQGVAGEKQGAFFQIKVIKFIAGNGREVGKKSQRLLPFFVPAVFADDIFPVGLQGEASGGKEFLK